MASTKQSGKYLFVFVPNDRYLCWPVLPGRKRVVWDTQMQLSYP